MHPTCDDTQSAPARPTSGINTALNFNARRELAADICVCHRSRLNARRISGRAISNFSAQFARAYLLRCWSSGQNRAPRLDRSTARAGWRACARAFHQAQTQTRSAARISVLGHAAQIYQAVMARAQRPDQRDSPRKMYLTVPFGLIFSRLPQIRRKCRRRPVFAGAKISLTAGARSLA